MRYKYVHVDIVDDIMSEESNDDKCKKCKLT